MLDLLSPMGLAKAGLGALGAPMFSLPKPVAVLGDMAKDFTTEIRDRMAEFNDPLRIVLISAGGVAGSLVGNQFIPATAGGKTDPGFYGQQMLLGVPALAFGQIVAEFFGGAPVVRAVVIGTIANAITQIPTAFTKDKNYNFVSFLVKEVVLVPLSLLLVRKAA